VDFQRSAAASERSAEA
jgi:hypothetical protein